MEEESRLSTLKDKLSKHTNVITLKFDVRDIDEVRDKIQRLPENWKKMY